MRKAVIIGGGIAGLATAYQLQQLGFTNYTLIESSPRWGGKISSQHKDGFLIEGGPDSFITQKSATLELCKQLGLENDLVGSTTGPAATTFVWSRGRLRPMPEGMMLMAPTMMGPFLRSSLISWPGKLRMGMELFVPQQHDVTDESLGGFVRRRLGQEALDKIAGPLMGGIHAADPDTLSLRSTFPMFLEMEKKHGSLLRAMMHRPKRKPQTGSAPLPMFMTLRGGLNQLAEAIVAQLPSSSLSTGCPVVAIQPDQDNYRVVMCDGSTIHATDLVFATPAYITADLLQLVDPYLSSRLRAIRYVSTTTVSLGFKGSDIQHPMSGAGFIVARNEGRRINACSWSSQKFANRAPQDSVLLRVFIGGASAEDLAEQQDATLIQIALEELRVIMGITAEPVVASASRWRKGNPQYEVGHEDRIREIESELAQLPGIQLAGAAYRGSGIPDCIQSGIRAANAVAARQHRQPDLKLVCTAS